jgi:hypothetical protein
LFKPAQCSRRRVSPRVSGEAAVISEYRLGRPRHPSRE